MFHSETHISTPVAERAEDRSPHCRTCGCGCWGRALSSAEASSLKRLRPYCTSVIGVDLLDLALSRVPCERSGPRGEPLTRQDWSRFANLREDRARFFVVNNNIH